MASGEVRLSKIDLFEHHYDVLAACFANVLRDEKQKALGTLALRVRKDERTRVDGCGGQFSI